MCVCVYVYIAIHEICSSLLFACFFPSALVVVALCWFVFGNPTARFWGRSWLKCRTCVRATGVSTIQTHAHTRTCNRTVGIARLNIAHIYIYSMVHTHTQSISPKNNISVVAHIVHSEHRGGAFTDIVGRLVALPFILYVYNMLVHILLQCAA